MEQKITARQYNYLKGLEKENKIELPKELLDISVEEADKLIKSANGKEEKELKPNDMTLLIKEVKRIADILQTR